MVTGMMKLEYSIESTRRDFSLLVLCTVPAIPSILLVLFISIKYPHVFMEFG